MKISRRAFLIAGTTSLIGGAAISAGCGGSSGGGCGRSVKVPSRSRAIPPVVDGGAYILSDIPWGGTPPNVRRGIGYPLPSVLNRSGQVATAELLTSGSGCGAVYLFQPRLWSTNANGRGGALRPISNLPKNPWPTVLNNAGLMAGLLTADIGPFGIVVITVPASGAASSVEPDPTGEGLVPDYMAADTTDSGKVLCLTPRKVYIFANGTADILPDLGPDLRFTGRVLRDDGTIIGYSQRRDAAFSSGDVFEEAAQASFIYRNGTYSDIGAPAGFSQTRAVHANAAGQIVGTVAANGSGAIRGFLYENGAFTLIGPEGFAPRAIAPDGTIVGQANNRAVLFRNGTLTDLNTQIGSGSGWVLNAACAINEAGQIVTVGTHPEDDSSRLTILTRA